MKKFFASRFGPLAIRLYAKVYAIIASLSVVFIATVAYAQDAGVSSESIAVLPDPTDIQNVAGFLVDAALHKNWGFVISFGVTVLVAMLRKWVPESTKVGAWFRSKLGGIVTTFVISFAGAFATMTTNNVPVSLDMLWKGLAMAITASGGWSIYKNVMEAVDEVRAKKAGLAAATSPADTLNK